MTSDPAEEAERTRQARGLEAAARRGELPDPPHALKAHLDDTAEGVFLYLLARWSLAARLVADAAPGADSVVDLGPLPVSMPNPNALIRVGTKHGNWWQAVTKGCESIAAAIDDVERGRNLAQAGQPVPG